ncbi:hypothetical protein KLPMMMO223M1_25805 [Klebsiella pneumoniae]|nr:Uncharacterised protein [Klebsiella pneumoniae]SSK76575.1 Uncharacterised protein [Klebsiella pneumoniae]SXH49801.1 Uncharacterised protein [Klebsiella pneumoniae]SXI09171.1 Uncharacterised protein [Klebsiella pneumoniae]SXU04353.1 Uncharacterised protein [Klebsiella pneumoniae]
MSNKTLRYLALLQTCSMRCFTVVHCYLVTCRPSRVPPNYANWALLKPGAQ